MVKMTDKELARLEDWIDSHDNATFTNKDAKRLIVALRVSRAALKEIKRKINGVAAPEGELSDYDSGRFDLADEVQDILAGRTILDGSGEGE